MSSANTDALVDVEQLGNEVWDALESAGHRPAPEGTGRDGFDVLKPCEGPGDHVAVVARFEGVMSGMATPGVRRGTFYPLENTLIDKRCRDGHHNGEGDYACQNCHCLCHRRDAKVERLMRSRDGWRRDANTFSENADYWRKRAEQAEAAITRVRQVRTWRNEDSRWFLFAEDVLSALDAPVVSVPLTPPTSHTPQGTPTTTPTGTEPTP